jgi:hypothetical protein
MSFFKKIKVIQGILTEDVFTHSLSFDGKNSTVYIKEHIIEFKHYDIHEILRKFETCFGLLLDVYIINDKIEYIETNQLFKIVDSAEQNGTTSISFLYKHGGDLYLRNVSKSSEEFDGFQSSGVLKPWFRLNEQNEFIIISEHIPYAYDIGYYNTVDYSASKSVIEKPERTNIGDDDFSFRIDDDLGF